MFRDAFHDRKLGINFAIIHATILEHCYVSRLIAVIGVVLL